MDRRKFIGAGSAALAALAFPKALHAQACPIPTTPDRYRDGPYYLPNAPRRSKLALDSEPGTRLYMNGMVQNCSGPVVGAMLEVWQATNAGCYIHPNQPTCEDHGNPQASRLWATLISDAQGAFAFETIKPGVYLNGSRYRPSHIHFRIRSPQGATDPVDVLTQLYFQGDPYIPGDYGADEPGALARTIKLDMSDGLFGGNFNVNLPGGTSALGGRIDPLADPNLEAFDAFVQRTGDRFMVFLPPLPSGRPVESRIYDATGTLVRRSLHTSSPVEFDASLWARGAYQVECKWWTDKGMRTETVQLRK